MALAAPEELPLEAAAPPTPAPAAAAAAPPPCLRAADDCCERERRAERRAWRRAIEEKRESEERKQGAIEGATAKKRKKRKSETPFFSARIHRFFRIDRDAFALAPVPTRRGCREPAGPRTEALRSAGSPALSPALGGMGGAAVVSTLSGEQEERGEH